jgi:hypothetical protein
MIFFGVKCQKESIKYVTKTQRSLRLRVLFGSLGILFIPVWDVFRETRPLVTQHYKIYYDTKRDVPRTVGFEM